MRPIKDKKKEMAVMNIDAVINTGIRAVVSVLIAYASISELHTHYTILNS